jgi:beta-glucanase (GH16 family)
LAFACTANAQNWKGPVWSDEFNATVPGAPLDNTKWTYDVGSEGWGNHELETYCAAGSSSPAPCDVKHPNAYHDGHGHLVIEAIRTSRDPASAGKWTSARIKTLGLKDFEYGRMEACMALPVGAGLWPAFWMLGTHGEWPAGGEMDIMENVPAKTGGGGLGPQLIESTIHGPSSSKNGIFSLGADFTFPAGGRVDDRDPACHVYGAIWSPFMVQIYVDDWRRPFFIRTANQVPAGGRWVFNAPFYFILNLAVGGDWPGPPDPDTPNPARVLVDYLRVYQAERVRAPKLRAEPIRFGPDHSGSTTLHLTGSAANGSVYLACSTDWQNASCVIDTQNHLNGAVVEFGATAEGTAKVTVQSNAAVDSNSLTVTAYTASGDQSSLSIPVGDLAGRR